MTETNGNGMNTKDLVLLLHEKVDRVLVDHEARIRSAETSVSRVKGAIALLALLVPIAAGLIAVYVH